MLSLQAHGQGTMPAPYKEVWHDLMALLARDTQLRKEIDRHKAAMPDTAATSPSGGAGCLQVAASDGEPSLLPPQHQQLPLPAAPQGQQQGELQRGPPPHSDAGDTMPDMDSKLHGRLAAVPPTTPKAAGCSAGDARASLSGDDVPFTGGVAATAAMHGHAMTSQEDDVHEGGRLALPAPPPPIAVTPHGASEDCRNRDPPSAVCGTANVSGASAGSGWRDSTTAACPIGQAASAADPRHGLRSPAVHRDVARPGFEQSPRGGQLTQQLPSGNDVRPTGHDQGSWLHDHALPWPVGGMLPQVR